MWKAGSAVGPRAIVHIDSRWLSIIKIACLDVRHEWHACSSERNTMNLVSRAKKKKNIKIRDLLIINRRGLVSLCNGWCYHLCQICTPQQDCAGNRISTRVKILQICAQWWSLSRYTTWPWIKFASLQCLSLLAFWILVRGKKGSTAGNPYAQSRSTEPSCVFNVNHFKCKHPTSFSPTRLEISIQMNLKSPCEIGQHCLWSVVFCAS